jgi:hypothetical protein
MKRDPKDTEADAPSPGEEFIELGLLFFVTGLAAVLAFVIVEFLLIRESGNRPDWVIITVGAVVLIALGVLLFRLYRRLLWFLRGLS